MPPESPDQPPRSVGPIHTTPRIRIRLEPFRASWLRWLSLATGVVLFRVLESSIPLPGAAAVGTGVWLLGHTVWSTRTLPVHRRWVRALAIAVIANVLATVVRVGWVVARHGSVDVAYGLILGLPAIAWFLPFTAAGALIADCLPDSRRFRKTVRIVAVPIGLYVATFTVAFDIRSGETHPYVEHADKRGRIPVVGPKVSLTGLSICPGEGPCFLWLCDHTGDEWLFRFHRPLVALWFRAHAGRYFNPDLEG